MLLAISVDILFCSFHHRILGIFHKKRVREIVRVMDAATILGVFDAEGGGAPTLSRLRNQRSSEPAAE